MFFVTIYHNFLGIIAKFVFDKTQQMFLIHTRCIDGEKKSLEVLREREKGGIERICHARVCYERMYRKAIP